MVIVITGSELSPKRLVDGTKPDMSLVSEVCLGLQPPKRDVESRVSH